MPPKRNVKQTARKPKAKVAAASKKAASAASVKAGAARTTKTAAASRQRAAAVVKRAAEAKKRVAVPVSKARASTRLSSATASAKPKPKPTAHRARPSTSRRRQAVPTVTKHDSCESDEDEKETASEGTSGSEEDAQINSSVMKTPVEISEEDEAVLLHCRSELAADPVENVGETRNSVNPAASGTAVVSHSLPLPLDGSSDATAVLFTTPSKADGAQRPPQQQEGVDPGSKEDSPEALTVDSESKRSSHRWRDHLLSNATTTTQLLRDEDDASREGEQSQSGAVRGSVAESDGKETVKRLFARPQRSISYSPLSSPASSSSPSSLWASSSSSLEVIGAAADRTLPMEEDREEKKEEKASRDGQHTATHPGSGIAEQANAHPKLSTNFDFCGRLHSRSPPSVVHHQRQQEATAEMPSTTAAHEQTAASLTRRSGDTSLLGGPTTLSGFHVGSSASSFSSAPLLPTQQDHNPSPSPQPKPVASFPLAHPPVDEPPQQQPQQQQQYTPSSSGHLFMGGSVSRARSPSNPTGRLSYGWLKKVNAGVSAPSTKDSLAHRQTVPATAGVFPAHPLSPQQQQQHQSPYSSDPSFATPPTAPSTIPDGERERERSCSNSSPPRLRPREPPAWRSPQPAHFPKSLNVSPASVRPPSSASRDPHATNARGDAAQAIGEESVALRCPRASETAPLPTAGTVTSSFPSTVITTTAAVVGQRERSHSNASSTSTAVLTQTFTQTSADTPSTNADQKQQQQQLQLVSTASARTPDASTAAVGDSAPDGVASRPSTQLITKAAATRPTASPATMWICLDDSDDDDEEEEDEESSSVGKNDESGRATTTANVERGGAGGGDASEGTAGLTSTQQRSTRRTSPENERVAAGSSVGEEQQQQQQQQRRSSPSRRRPAEKSHPIADILSPTFRPRRRPPLSFPSFSPNNDLDNNKEGEDAAQASADVTHRLESDPRRCFIQLDDESDEEAEEEEEEDGEAPPRKRARVSVPPTSSPTSPVGSPVTAAVATPERAAAAAVTSKLLSREPRSSPPLIIDDDDDEDENEEAKARTTPQRKAAAPRLSIQLPTESDDSQVTSPLKPAVKDLVFPKRLDPEVRPSSPLYQSIHAYQQHYQQQQQQQQQDESETKTRHSTGQATFHVDGAVSRTAGRSTTIPGFPTTAADATAHTTLRSKTKLDPQRGTTAVSDSPGRKRRRAQASGNGSSGGGEKASLVPALPDWGRPADTLLRDFFPTKFTKKNFMEAAQKVMSPMHFLEPHDFWAAFHSAEFVGEGSFGLVWRCRTVDGDLVAVKSCPIILRTRANIEDSFSTIREIATMRFLNEMQVPYVLPLHSAFYVKASEALPPLAQEAAAWRQALRKKAEAVVLAKEVQLLGKGHATVTKRSGGVKGRSSTVAVATTSSDAPLTFEQQVEAEMTRQAAAETREEKAVRARLQGVRLPRFLSITEDDLRQSDATAFLVMELCDGDVEGIPRSDGVAKGVVYCVSSALAAMHELGLLHLDLKPSNVLFAYEHGPSQAATPAITALQPATDAVKFYLSDFGNCRLVGPGPLAEVAESYGTFEYMDLRALQDAVCGRPTDAFSLGATLYELLYGRRLYPKCTNPKCAMEEDHTRACFVAAARRPVVLPPTLPSMSSSSGSAATAANGELSRARQSPSTDGLRPGSHGGKMAGGPPSSTASVAPQTPLQTLTLALLQRKWSERMTAAECRRFLIDAFHITQADTVEGRGGP